MVAAYLRHVARFSSAAKLFLAGAFLEGIGHGILWVLRNLFLKECGLSEGFIGNTMSIAALGTLVVAVPLAFFMDRGRLKGYVIAGTLAFAGGLAGMALWPKPLPILASNFVAGGGMALLGIGSAPFFMRHSTPEERPFLFAVGTAIGPAAGLVGGGLVWLLSLAWGEGFAAQRAMLLVAAGVSAASIPVFALLREAPAEAPPPGPRRLVEREAIMLCAPNVLIGLGAGLTIPFINLYFRDRFGQGPGAISVLFSVAQVATFFAFLAAPVVARRAGGVRTIVACQLLSIPFFVVMAFTQSLWLAMAGFLGRHALMNMAMPVAANFAMEVVPSDQRALTSGLRELTWDGAWLVSTSLGGWMIQHTRLVHDGYTVTMLVTIGLYVAGSGAFWMLWRKSPAMPPGPHHASRITPDGTHPEHVAPAETPANRP